MKKRTWQQQTPELDYYYLNVLINSLFCQSKNYNEETNYQINILVLRLVNISDTMKPNRKKKITFEPEERSLIRYCLTHLLNNQIQAEKQTAVEVISKLLMSFAS